MKFFLGTHKPMWLADARCASVPLFISRRTLGSIKRLPRAVTSWALDSGGFTELNLHGRWTTTAAQYVADVRRFRDEIGRLEWAAPQDWMCEPTVLAKTGLTVEEHQIRTVQNFVELRSLAPDLPIIPVLQGWSVIDYWRCADIYNDAGINLAAEPLVGVGTVCRRQGGISGSSIMTTLASMSLKLHGFGFKTQGLKWCASAPAISLAQLHSDRPRPDSLLVSADSLAWSYDARRSDPLDGHTHGHCGNCLEYALGWRRNLAQTLAEAA